MLVLFFENDIHVLGFEFGAIASYGVNDNRYESAQYVEPNP